MVSSTDLWSDFDGGFVLFHMLPKVPVFVVQVLGPYFDLWLCGYGEGPWVILEDSNPWSDNSSNNLIRGFAVLSPSLMAISSTYVGLKAVSLCIWDIHVTRQPAYFTMQPVLDLAKVQSSWAESAFQFPQKSASHYR